MKRPHLRENTLDDVSAWWDVANTPIGRYIEEIDKYATHLEKQLKEAQNEIELMRKTHGIGGSGAMIKRLKELSDGAEAQCRRAQAEREQAVRERDAAAREVTRLLAVRETLLDALQAVKEEGGQAGRWDVILGIIGSVEPKPLDGTHASGSK
jgi:chromosome segregation ATPase